MLLRYHPLSIEFAIAQELMPSVHILLLLYPRLRFDQLMRLAWRGLIPITITMMLLTGFMVFLRVQHWWWYSLANVAVAIGAAAIGPMLPADSVNRRVRLAGSRFYPKRENTLAHLKGQFHSVDNAQ